MTNPIPFPDGAQALHAKIVRVKSGSIGNRFFPIYHLQIKNPNSSDDLIVLSAQKQTGKRALTGYYLISLDSKNFKKGAENYVGKLRSNVMQTEYILYGHGRNPKRRKRSAKRSRMGSDESGGGGGSPSIVVGVGQAGEKARALAGSVAGSVGSVAGSVATRASAVLGGALEKVSRASSRGSSRSKNSPDKGPSPALSPALEAASPQSPGLVFPQNSPRPERLADDDFDEEDDDFGGEEGEQIREEMMAIKFSKPKNWDPRRMVVVIPGIHPTNKFDRQRYKSKTFGLKTNLLEHLRGGKKFNVENSIGGEFGSLPRKSAQLVDPGGSSSKLIDIGGGGTSPKVSPKASPKVSPKVPRSSNPSSAAIVSSDDDEEAEKNMTFLRFVNRMPRWDTEKKMFRLNFYGRVKMRSAKNFQILTDLVTDNVTTVSSASGESFGETLQEQPIVAQFGRWDENTFHLDGLYPFSLLQLFGLALSTFDARVLMYTMPFQGEKKGTNYPN